MALDRAMDETEKAMEMADNFRQSVPDNSPRVADYADRVKDMLKSAYGNLSSAEVIISRMKGLLP